MRLLLWYSGEHPDLPRAEASAVFQAWGLGWDPQVLAPRLDAVEVVDRPTAVAAAVPRLGLTHDASESLAEATYTATPPPLDRLAPAVSFCVRAEPVSPTPKWTSVEAERKVGAWLAPGRRVDLSAPDVVVRAFLGQDRVWLGRRIWDRDPQETAARHARRRPRASPVSLHPKLARALVNLARIPPGGTVLDPFCGTGGILLEAAALGYRVFGSDLDPEMVTATRTNLTHYGFSAGALEACDIDEAPRRFAPLLSDGVDAVVADLPYGRSASTGKEERARLYRRAFTTFARLTRAGGHVVVGTPNGETDGLRVPGLEPVSSYRVRVHRSLTRHFQVLRRGPH